MTPAPDPAGAGAGDERLPHAIPLTEDGVSPDPFVQFGRWFDDAAGVVRLPEAMAVATASASGAPSVRMVLLKSWDHRGFVFHTNYSSRKGEEVDENPSAALLFHWDPLGRQVRIEGRIARIDPQESDAHFATRPRGAQIGAHASWQSRPVANRDELDRRVRQEAERVAAAPIARPPWWGGYRVDPETFEFWQNREDRLHDRLLYRRVHRDGPVRPGAAGPAAGGIRGARLAAGIRGERPGAGGIRGERSAEGTPGETTAGPVFSIERLQP